MNPQPTVQLPGQWSTVAPEVDWMYYFLYWVSVAFFVAITGAAIYFCIRYRRRPGVEAEPTGHNTALEIAWTVIPSFLLVALFHYGFKGYLHLRVPPEGSIEVRVHAKKWLWEFEYANGARSVTDMHVPVNRPVRVILSSDDVLHSFFIPAFRVKQDATPGSYQSLWFQATHTGVTDIFCTEYCGTGHSAMHGNVHIESQAQFEHFLETAFDKPAGITNEQWGEQMYHQYQCSTCHSTTGAPGTGPTWQHLFGRQEHVSDGDVADRVITVNEAYIRESILQPQAKVVRGFQPVMPTFQGTLRDRQIDAIISYIRSLR